VTHPRYPLRFNIGFLLNVPLGTFRDFEFEFPALRFSQDFELQEFHGVVRITRTAEGLLAEGDFKGKIGAECVRCLDTGLITLHSQFQELYAFRSHVREEGDAELVVPDDGYIDLTSLVHEYMILEIPISPLCKPDCAGLCPVCGVNWNLEPCEHREQSLQP